MWNTWTNSLIAKISIEPELIRIANRTKIDTFMGTIDLIIRGLRIVVTRRDRSIFIMLGDVSLILIPNVQAEPLI